ncbi:hypothetical protein BaRGS_00019047 [Batillaria attramentaria]|uniref:Uncharacterized protein n=1 Tax=Batillaria attramentaria TaxID=370345 RepID=A0ABD0KR29_9CAEN
MISLGRGHLHCPTLSSLLTGSSRSNNDQFGRQKERQYRRKRRNGVTLNDVLWVCTNLATCTVQSAVQLPSLAGLHRCKASGHDERVERRIKDCVVAQRRLTVSERCSSLAVTNQTMLC